MLLLLLPGCHVKFQMLHCMESFNDLCVALAETFWYTIMCFGISLDNPVVHLQYEALWVDSDTITYLQDSSNGGIARLSAFDVEASMQR
jgi:hypothetical protein